MSRTLISMAPNFKLLLNRALSSQQRQESLSRREFSQPRLLMTSQLYLCIFLLATEGAQGGHGP